MLSCFFYSLPSSPITCKLSFRPTVILLPIVILLPTVILPSIVILNEVKDLVPRHCFTAP